MNGHKTDYKNLQKLGLHKLFPHTYAHYCSDGHWKMFPHLSYISKTIVPDLIKGNARYIVELGPRHGKSSFLSVWLPIWLMDIFGEYKIILASYGQRLSEYFTAACIAYIKGYKKIDLKVDPKVASRTFFRTNKGGQFLSTAVGGVAIGMGAQTFLIDDVHKNWNEAMSENIRERNKQWYRTVVTTRLEKGGNVIIIGTRWSETDLLGWLKSKTEDEEGQNYLGKFKTISIKAICEDETEDPLKRKKGQPICEELFTRQDLELKKQEMGPLHFEAHYQCNPIPAKGNIIFHEDIQYYDYLPQMERKIIVADLSYQKTLQGSFSCIETWGQKDNAFYLIESLRERCNYSRQKELIRIMKKKHEDVFEIYIEKFANGQAAIDDLSKEISGIKAVTPKTSKEARLHIVSDLYKQKRVFYPNTEYIRSTNVMELTHFPFFANDDTVDCATMALTKLSQSQSAVTFLKKLTGV